VAVASCWLGLRTRTTNRRRGLLVGLNVALLVACIPVLDHLRQPSPAERAVQAWERWAVSAPPALAPGLALDGRPVANIYPYSRDGRLLLDVLLYDDTGRPIDLRANSVDPNRRLLVTTTGAAVYNSFPVRYYEPGTRTVADPTAGPKPGRRSFVTPVVRGAKKR
jgi:hypothetical protein